MPVQREDSVREIVMVQESVRETVTVQESSSMNWDPVIAVVGLAVAHYVAKLGKTQLQSVVIYFAIMGAVLFRYMVVRLEGSESVFDRS